MNIPDKIEVPAPTAWPIVLPASTTGADVVCTGPASAPAFAGGAAK